MAQQSARRGRKNQAYSSCLEHAFMIWFRSANSHTGPQLHRCTIRGRTDGSIRLRADLLQKSLASRGASTDEYTPQSASFLPANNLHLICLERTMLKLKSLLLGSMFGLLVVSAAVAQVTIDVSKITCNQYVLDQVTDFRTIIAWLDGFYSGKRNNTVVDTRALERNADKVEEYCRSHRDMPLMQAVETTLGGGDRAVGSKK